MLSLRLFLIVCASSCFPLNTLLAQFDRPDIGFTTNVQLTITTNVGANYVFVAGNAATLGAWDKTLAPRLRNVGNNVWQISVALPLGANTEYRFFSRSMASSSFGTNVTWLGTGNSNFSAPPIPAAPYTGKTIYYLSGWTNANILWRQTNSEAQWSNSPMTRIGQGRLTNENLYAINVGNAGIPIEFVPNDGGANWDNAFGIPNSNYLTPLDFAYLQDGHIYNYVPPPSPSVPRIVTTNISSSYSGIPSRRVRALLPRGYDENTNKRYPVLYMHDGQNDFDPGGPYGSWSADATSKNEIQMGRMRETIIVAIDNTSERMTEYSPPQDNSGTGDRYRNFVVNNVRPWLDTHFRTLNDPPNTGVMGSSLGGLISHYMGTSTNVFGLIAPMSPSYWYAPNWTTSFNNAPKPTGRLFYMDWGTAESDGSMWVPAWNMINTMAAKGFSFNDDLFYLVGVGQAHNEAAWALRLPYALRYLYDIRREANILAGIIHPPSLTLVSTTPTNNARKVSLNFPTLGGFNYHLQNRSTLTSGTWSNALSLPPTYSTRPWENVNFSTNISTNTPANFFRLRSN